MTHKYRTLHSHHYVLALWLYPVHRQSAGILRDDVAFSMRHYSLIFG